MALVAGVDCSTQATKVLVVDVDTGEVVATGRATHEVTGTGGARETHPDVWWGALRTALDATGRAADVDALAVAGQQHGLVVLDADSRPLRPAMLWNDTRAANDAELLRDTRGADWWAHQIGLVPVASFTVSKWAWLRRTEPDVVAAAAAVRLPHDVLTSWLVGEGVTDRGDVSGTGWWSPRTGAYVDDVLELPAVDLDPALLPRVLGASEAAGSVRADVAAELGLRPDVVVGPGTGDNMGAALGLGLAPGTPVVSLGTSGTAYTVSTSPSADPSGAVAGFADAADAFLPLAATLNCTLAVDRTATLLGIDREAVAPATSCVVLPYLDGERTPDLPRSAGTVLGLRHETTAEQVLRAAYEGAAASLLDVLDTIDAHSSGIPADAPVVLIGGGARGAAWREVVMGLSGRGLQVPDHDELVALGAAVQAAAVLTGQGLREVAQHWDTRRGRVVEPPAEYDGGERLARIREVRALASDVLEADLFR